MSCCCDPTEEGAQTFLELTDTPNTYAGSALLGVRVNAAETGLEFFAIGGGGAVGPAGAIQFSDGAGNFQGTGNAIVDALGTAIFAGDVISDVSVSAPDHFAQAPVAGQAGLTVRNSGGANRGRLYFDEPTGRFILGGVSQDVWVSVISQWRLPRNAGLNGAVLVSGPSGTVEESVFENSIRWNRSGLYAAGEEGFSIIGNGGNTASFDLLSNGALRTRLRHDSINAVSELVSQTEPLEMVQNAVGTRWQLPQIAGASGQVLTKGAGNTSTWATPATSVGTEGRYNVAGAVAGTWKQAALFENAAGTSLTGTYQSLLINSLPGGDLQMGGAAIADQPSFITERTRGQHRTYVLNVLTHAIGNVTSGSVLANRLLAWNSGGTENIYLDPQQSIYRLVNTGVNLALTALQVATHHYTVRCTAGGIDITLPDPTVRANCKVTVKDGAGAAGGAPIDVIDPGGTIWTINVNFGWVTFQSDGAAWQPIETS